MLTALLLGSATALCWGGGAAVAAVSARLGGPFAPLFWGSLFGMAVCAALALPSGLPSGGAEDWTYAAIAGVGLAVGKILYMMAFESGHVSLVTPITACDGAVATVMALATGAAISTQTAAGLAAIVAGTLLIAASGSVLVAQAAVSTPSRTRPIGVSVALSVGAAVSFGTVFFTSGSATGMEPLWVVFVALAPGAALGAALLMSGGRSSGLRPTPELLKLYGALAVLESLGFATYVWGSSSDLIVAAVAASQYAAIAVVIGVVVMRERLSRTQLGGVALLIAAGALVAAQA